MNVTILGAGYVGLVSGVCLASRRHRVTCVDIDSTRIEAIQRGRAPIEEPGLDRLLSRCLSDGSFAASTELSPSIESSDVVMIAVGTPTKDGRSDLSMVRSASESVGRLLRGQERPVAVVVKSTVPPGTTADLVRPAVEEAMGGARASIGFTMNPEFLRQGSAVDDFLAPDRIVIGADEPWAGDLVEGLYQGFKAPILRMTTRSAEMAKYASNALLATMISFSNELATLCESFDGADVNDVIDSLQLDRRLTPIGAPGQSAGIVSYLRPGIGFGGSCLPKDLAALRRFAKDIEVSTPILDGVLAINQRRPAAVVELLKRHLGSLTDKTIALVGLTFKPGTDDTRDSPAIPIATTLLQEGARVVGYDPVATSLAPTLPELAIHSNPSTAFRGADAAVLCFADAGQRQWDWRALCKAMRRPLILDGRGALRGLSRPESMEYRVIGRSG